MLSIRLARVGKKKKPSYRIIICQKHKDPFGDYIEKIGHVNYYGGKKNIELDAERAAYWLAQGAQPTDTVHNLFIEQGITKDKKVLPQGIKPDKAAAEKAKAEAEAKAEEADKEPVETPVENEGAPVEEKKEESTEETKEEAPAKEEKKEENEEKTDTEEKKE